MELYIDNRAAEIDDATQVAVSLSVAATGDPRTARAGYTRSVRLPLTPTNDAIFAYAAEPLSAARFNATPHTGRIEHEGAVLIEGDLHLSRAERSPQGGFYEVHIIGAGRRWAARASTKPLRDTQIEYAAELTGTEILESWSGLGPVRFLPVVRETYIPDHSSGSVVAAAKILSSDDYHPFLHAATLLRAIFAESGYTVESDFVDGEFFSSLHISGNWPSRDTSVVKANMDFLARRFAPASAVADSRGRVWADPYLGHSSVGNIVDTADPRQSSGGVSFDDVFSRGGCFRRDDKRICFVPTSPVSVGFQYRLRYTSDYRIESRERLAGFDTVSLGEEQPRTFLLPNPWVDRREGFRYPQIYTLAIFGDHSGVEFEFRYFNAAADKVYRTPVLKEPFGKVEVVVEARSPQLYYRVVGATVWKKYRGDWALYDGYVKQTGTIDVELTLRAAPETITPGSPKYFDTIFFGGAQPGMKLTLAGGIWVRPIFYAQPTLGARVGFADVCSLAATQMDLVDAFRQMFNLRFHTDPRAGVVRIEPADTFYCPDRIVDWSSRIDRGRAIVIEEPTEALARGMVWRYRHGDGATAKFNRSEGGEFGSWRAAPLGWGDGTVRDAAEGPSVWENPLFTPSLTISNSCWGAPGGLLVQAGDTSIDRLDGTGDLNFAPKIVRYEGLAPLPAGQNWGWPAIRNGLYPRLAFHAPTSGYTLCFEDRDGCRGLNSFWRGEVAMWSYSRKMTVWLSLDATDIESLSFPRGHGADFRCLYRLALDGEDALWRLEEVCDYTPAAASTKCVFIKHIPQP